MDRPTLERRRTQIVERFGPWTGYNLDLGGGVYTIGPGLTGVAESRVAFVVQALSDLVGGRLDGLRVLDLGTHEGAFAVELARRGAEVVAIDGGEGHVAKARLAGEALGLDNLEVVHADVRRLDADAHGAFDAVLCLGLLSRLDVEALFPFVEALAGACRRVALIETRVSLRARRRASHRGRGYGGMECREGPADPGASVEAERSFWLTRASLANLLADVGFTSVWELLLPRVPELIEFADLVTLAAVRGAGVGETVAVRQAADTSGRLPERAPAAAHPAHGARHALRDRIARARGGGLPALFRKRPGGVRRPESRP